jgi:short-subunit dehydrogenase involved in D-alanine esterification of teichoic acids
VTWPTLHFEANTVMSRGGGGGFGVAIAQNEWECDWVRAIRARDEKSAAVAQTEAQRLLHANVVVAPAGASEN